MTLAGCAAQRPGVSDHATEPQTDLQPFVRTLPDTSDYVRLLAAPESVALHSGLMTLRSGADCGWHSTEGYEEMVICLAGEGEIEVQGRSRVKLSAGQYAYNPPQTQHNIFNTGPQPLRYVYVVAPVGGQAQDHTH